MYDPSLGRWLTPDPIEYEGGDVNLYGFVSNEPTNATDPSGLREKPNEGPTKVTEDGTVLYIVSFSGKQLSAADTRLIHNRLKSLHYFIKAAMKKLEEKPLSNKTRDCLVKWFVPPGKAADDATVAKIQSTVLGTLKKIQTGMADGFRLKFVENPDIYGSSQPDGIHINIAKPKNPLDKNRNFLERTEANQIGILFHEFSHLMAGTGDHGYMSVWGQPGAYEKDGKNVDLTMDMLLKNADTYQGFLESCFC